MGTYRKLLEEGCHWIRALNAEKESEEPRFLRLAPKTLAPAVVSLATPASTASASAAARRGSRSVVAVRNRRLSTVARASVSEVIHAPFYFKLVSYF